MEFTVTGKRRGRSVSMHWEDGAVRSDLATLDVLHATSLMYENSGRKIVHFMEPLRPPYLTNPRGALIMMRAILDTVESETGDVPQPREQKEGEVW